LKSIFEAFDKHEVGVDVVSTSEVSVSVTAETNEAIPALAADLAKLADVKYEGRKAIVCLVGENLRDTPGIAAKVFGILENVKIRMISQGASEINLTFVIEENDAAEVVRRLHKAFFATSIRKCLHRVGFTTETPRHPTRAQRSLFRVSWRSRRLCGV